MAKNESPFSSTDIDDELDAARVKEPVVDLDSPDDDDDPEEQAGPTRLEKRKARKWMSVEERERLAGLERENIENKARADAATNALQAIAPFLQQNRQPQQQQVDPIDMELDRADADRALLDREYAARVQDTRNPMTQEEANEFRKKAVGIERKQMELIAHKANRNNAPAQDHTNQAIRAWLAAHHPEGSQDQRVLNYAEGIQRTEAAMGKNPLSVEVMEKAMDQAERAFRMGKYKNGAPRDPDPNLRDRYVGAPRGSSGQGPKSMERKVSMTKDMERMANAAYPEIKDKGKRYKHWYSRVHGDEE